MTKKVTLTSLMNRQLEATKNFLISEEPIPLKEEFRLFYEASKIPFLISVGIAASYDTAVILSHYLK